MNTKFKKTLEKLGEGETIVVFTEEGEKLVGVPVNFESIKFVNPQIGMLSGEKGIWLKRGKGVTFLGDHNIKLVRKANLFEKEIDNANKMS